MPDSSGEDIFSSLVLLVSDLKLNKHHPQLDAMSSSTAFHRTFEEVSDGVDIVVLCHPHFCPHGKEPARDGLVAILEDTVTDDSSQSVFDLRSTFVPSIETQECCVARKYFEGSFEMRSQHCWLERPCGPRMHIDQACFSE